MTGRIKARVPRAPGDVGDGDVSAEKASGLFDRFCRHRRHGYTAHDPCADAATGLARALLDGVAPAPEARPGAFWYPA